MPKMKTHKATAKRIRRTKGGKGKLRRPQGRQSHFRRNRSKRAKRKFDEMAPVDNPGTRKRLRRLLPYASHVAKK